MDNYSVFNNFYHEWHEDGYEYRGGRKWSFYLITSILKYIKNDKNEIYSIIDIGSGEGGKANLLAHYFTNAKVLGIDFTDEGILLSNKKYSKNNISFKKLDVMDINENEEKYDLVTSFEVLEHVEEWQKLLKKMINISNKYVLISVPTGRMREYEKDIGHLRNFKKGEIEEFMNKNGLKIVKTYYAGFPFYSPLGRNWLNTNSKKYYKNIEKKFGFKQKMFHHLLYILFKYFSLKSVGDAFYGLFEIDSITTNSNGGGGNL